MSLLCIPCNKFFIANNRKTRLNRCEHTQSKKASSIILSGIAEDSGFTPKVASKHIKRKRRERERERVREKEFSIVLGRA